MWRFHCWEWKFRSTHTAESNSPQGGYLSNSMSGKTPSTWAHEDGVESKHAKRAGFGHWNDAAVLTPCLQDREEKKGTRNPRGNVHPESFNPNTPNSTKTVPLIHCPSVIERPKMALAVVYSSSNGSSLHSIHFGSEYAGNVANYRTSMTEINKKRYERSWHTLTLHQNSSLFVTLTPSLLSPPMTSLVVWNIKGSSVDNVTWATQSTGKLPKKLPTELEVPNVEATLKKVWEGALDHLPRANRDSKNPI